MENTMSRHLGMRRGGNTRLTHSARGLGALPRRRIGRARSYDVFDAAGTVVIRNISAETATIYVSSLTAEDVVDGVATRHFIDADGFRITAHMAIAG
jgi:hypothetical protein